MLIQQVDEGLMSKIEEDVPLSMFKDSNFRAKETEMKRIKQESEEVQVKKKAKLEWRREDCARPVGKLIKFTGEGETKKCHYEIFEFRGTQYGLEDLVLLVPENTSRNAYIAIIKDIYVQEKDGHVKLEVQWLYRRKDIEIENVGKWESEDSREIFFSFHRDEVFAESVKQKCLVYFVPDDKQIPKCIEYHHGFIVQKVYDNINKKLMKFSYKGFDVQQKFEIDVLVAKTISRIGHLPDIEKVQMTKILRPKRSVRKRCVVKAERMSSKPVKETLESLPSSDLDRDKRLEELLEAVLKHMCCASTGNQAGFDFVSPDNVILMVFALEKALYDSFADDIPKNNYKLKLLVEKLENSRVLSRRLLKGELKPEQVIKMKGYELIIADFEEPKLVKDAGFTSKKVEPKKFLED